MEKLRWLIHFRSLKKSLCVFTNTHTHIEYGYKPGNLGYHAYIFLRPCSLAVWPYLRDRWSLGLCQWKGEMWGLLRKCRKNILKQRICLMGAPATKLSFFFKMYPEILGTHHAVAWVADLIQSGKSFPEIHRDSWKETSEVFATCSEWNW